MFLFHCSMMKIRGKTINLLSWYVVVINVSTEMCSLMKSLRCLFQCGLSPQSRSHTSLKRWLIGLRNFCLSSCLLHRLTSGRGGEQEGMKGKRPVSSICNFISDIKNTLCQHQRPDKSWMELETTLVSESFSELQTALAPLLGRLRWCFKSIQTQAFLFSFVLLLLSALYLSLTSLQRQWEKPMESMQNRRLLYGVVPHVDIRLHGYL